ASSAAPPTPDALSNNAPHGSHFRPPTKTHRINSHDNYPDAAGWMKENGESYLTNKSGSYNLPTK
ncbi:hypothetical protein JTL48_36710, partial [Pseudomonas aeruginosa]|nr:hypothetical protein [Pseudomonas aeruginosa]MBN1005025.1 hypothetical protein [Pseudomonas aeruginosa]